MKNILFIGCILTCLSACIKTQDVPLCSNAPAAPVIDSTNFHVNAGSGFNVIVMNPNTSLTYVWTSPSGINFMGSTLYYPAGNYPSSPYGRWKVVAQNGSPLCASDSTGFNVIEPFTTCIGLDSVFLDGLGTFPLTYQGAVNTGDYYDMTFTSNAAELDVYFPTKPTVNGVWYVTDGAYDVEDDYCYVNFSYGGVDYSTYNTGTVTVSVNGSQITVYFCGLELESNYDYYDYLSNGYVIGN